MARGAQHPAGFVGGDAAAIGKGRAGRASRRTTTLERLSLTAGARTSGALAHALRGDGDNIEGAGAEKDHGEGVGPSRKALGPDEAQNPGKHGRRQPRRDCHVLCERGQASRERGETREDRPSERVGEEEVPSCRGQLADAAAGRTTAKYTSTAMAGPAFPTVRPTWNGSPGTTAVLLTLRRCRGISRLHVVQAPFDRTVFVSSS